MRAISAKKLAQHAIKRLIWAILPALGEYFRAIANHSRRWANFVAPMLLTAPQDETVSTIAGASVRLHETHDAFARQNCAENRCIWLAMVSSVSPEAKHTPAKAMTVSRELPAAVPAGGGKAWLRCQRAVARPGRTTSRRAEPHISDQAPPVWRAPEGSEGPGYGARGRWRGLAGRIYNTAPQAPPVWRAPEIRMFRDFDPQCAHLPKGPGRDKDLPDPWYGDYGDFVDTLAVIERSTPALVDYVRP